MSVSLWSVDSVPQFLLTQHIHSEKDDLWLKLNIYPYSTN